MERAAQKRSGWSRSLYNDDTLFATTDSGMIISYRRRPSVRPSVPRKRDSELAAAAAVTDRHGGCGVAVRSGEDFLCGRDFSTY